MTHTCGLSRAVPCVGLCLAQAIVTAGLLLDSVYLAAKYTPMYAVPATLNAFTLVFLRCILTHSPVCGGLCVCMDVRGWLCVCVAVWLCWFGCGCA